MMYLRKTTTRMRMTMTIASFCGSTWRTLCRLTGKSYVIAISKGLRVLRNGCHHCYNKYQPG